MGSMGIGEIVLVFLIFLVLFGAARLPALANSLGIAVRRFRSESKGDRDREGEGGSER